MSAARNYGGEFTAILARSVRPTSFLPGAVLVVLAGAIGLLGVRAGLPGIVVPLWSAIGSLVVVRFGLNAAYGDPGGGLLDTSGGPWAEVFKRAIHMATLNLVWAIPVGLLVSGVGEFVAGRGTPSTPPPMALLLLFAVAGVPPLVLILALATDSFVDSLRPGTWKSVFGGRGEELLAVFAMFVGGTCATVLGAFVFAFGVGGAHRGLFVFLLLTSLAWGLGVVHALLGRLVGGFLRSASEDGADDPAFESGPIDDGGDDDFVPIDLDQLVVPAVRQEGVADAPGGTETAAAREAATSVLDRLKTNESIADDDVFLGHEDAVQMEAVFGPHPQVLSRIALLGRRCERDDALDTARRALEAARKVSNRGVLADLHEGFGAELADAWTVEEIPLMAASLAARDRHDAALDLYGRALGETDAPLPLVKAMIQWADDLLKRETTAEIALRVYDALEESQPDHPFVEFVDRGRQVAARKLQRVSG